MPTIAYCGGAKLIVFLIMGFVTVGGAVLALVSVGLPLFWDEALAEIVREKPGMDTSNLLPGLLSIFALGILVLGLLWPPPQSSS